MPVVYIFNHDELYNFLLEKVSVLLKFEYFRISVYHGIKGIVSTDEFSVSRTELNGALSISNPNYIAESPSQ